MIPKHYDWLIVGAGFTGSVLAERLANAGDQSVLVIDQRSHIGGNAFDQRNDAGILYHQYGPHIFHTNSQMIADYLSQFTEWMHYEHRVLGWIDDRLIPIPFNLTSLNILFPKEKAQKLTNFLVSSYGMNTKVPILKMQQSENLEIRDLAEFIYQKVFLGYTVKQWSLRPEDLSASVTARVPVHISYDDRYFQDTFQNMPKEGYTKLFKRLLKHRNINVSLNTSFSEISKKISYSRMIYTGAVDTFFDYTLGQLPYRSLKFDFQTYEQRIHQPVAQVNYPMSADFTRITEMGHLTQEWSDKTTVAIEFPCAHVPGENDPYYPIPRDANQMMHQKYLDFAAKEAKNVIFCGRLGDYKYYNMDQAVGHALAIFRRLCEGHI